MILFCITVFLPIYLVVGLIVFDRTPACSHYYHKRFIIDSSFIILGWIFLPFVHRVVTGRWY